MELKPVPKVAKAKNMFPCKGSDVKSLFPEDILTSFERTTDSRRVIKSGTATKIIGQIGKGAFGSVIKCYDHKTKTEVAIKMVKN